MRLRATADRVTDRLEERLEPTRERASEHVAEAGERVREAVSEAPDVAERIAEDVGQRSRRAAERLERYVEDHLDDRTLRVWGPRVAYAAGGFVIGLLLGWLLTRRRSDRSEDELDVAEPTRTAGTTGGSAFRAVGNN